VEAGDPARPARLWWLAALVVALFVPLFPTRGIGAFDFWWWMASAITITVALAAVFDRSYRRALAEDVRTGLGWKIAAGILTAGVLYAVFVAGNAASRWLIPGAGSQIAAVYRFKEGAAPLRVVLLMGLVIGPGEELVWRAFLQRLLCDRFGAFRGWGLATLVYAAVHLGTANGMLVLAALLCGAFWGALYLRYRSVVLTAVSHTVWDLAVFVVVPFQ
jgi:membrane protease YdiL (CAAX protease family)